jgi:hypothetical protein
VNESYVTDDLRARADDIVWRVRCGEHYVYVLIEFQSTNEPFMPVRVLAYEGLLFQDLIRTGKISQEGGRLPAVLPIVLYNGRTRWTAPEDLVSLAHGVHRELWRYQPQCRYLLIDGSSPSPESDGSVERNLVVALLRIERCRNTENIPARVSGLMHELKRSAPDSLRRAFRVWLEKVFLARFGEEVAASLELLWEESTMLSDTLDRWERVFLWRGRREGRKEGKAELLTDLLQKRFGALPAELIERVRSATPEELKQWSEQLLDARSLDEMFGGVRSSGV